MSTHIWVDAENINPLVFKEAYTRLNKRDFVAKCDIYGKPDCIPKLYSKYSGNRFVTHNVFFGKNSADTFMCTDIVKACYEEPCTDNFVIITEDRDFSCAIKVLTDAGKNVTLVTEQNRVLSNLETVGVDLKHVESLEISVYHKSPTDTTCFFVFGDTIKEVPFTNGIGLGEFGNTLRCMSLRKYYSKNRTLTKICEDNLLKVVDGRVYFKHEEEYVKIYIKDYSKSFSYMQSKHRKELEIE